MDLQADFIYVESGPRETHYFFTDDDIDFAYSCSPIYTGTQPLGYFA